MPPPMRMAGPPKKAKDAKKTLLRLLSYLKKYIGFLLLVMVCIVLAAIASTVGSTALGSLVQAKYRCPCCGEFVAGGELAEKEKQKKEEKLTWKSFGNM